MFSGFMVNAWQVGTIVAIVAGVVGFFVVLRGSAFPAHAIPNGAFAGAAGANLLAINPLIGLGVFSLAAALGIGAMSRRGRRDAVTALVLVMMLALGAAFLSQSTEYEPQIFSLLFGEILGVSASEILPVVVIGAACVLAVGLMYRRLLLTSTAPEIACGARSAAPARRDGLPPGVGRRHHDDRSGRGGAADLHPDDRSHVHGPVFHGPRRSGDVVIGRHRVVDGVVGDRLRLRVELAGRVLRKCLQRDGLRRGTRLRGVATPDPSHP